MNQKTPIEPIACQVIETLAFSHAKVRCHDQQNYGALGKSSVTLKALDVPDKLFTRKFHKNYKRTTLVIV
ncbi:MAG: hypothetical protein HYY67_03825 [Thaumarchaeota archaeon]|nr:hypothetical protein [Nitrososphaerota archaeon]